MKPSLVILFCNDTYGRPYETAFRAWRKHLRPPQQGWIIKSGRRSYSKARLKSGCEKLRHRWTLYYLNHVVHRRDQCLYMENINVNVRLLQLLRRPGVMGLVAGFNQIFHPALINRFYALYNFHSSLLPYYRGPVPSYWCIAQQEQVSGVTLHRLTEHIDAGDILAQIKVDIHTMYPDRLDQDIAHKGAGLMLELLEAQEKGIPLPLYPRDLGALYQTRVNYRSFPSRETAL